jgi:hypothetical protein
MSPMSFSMIARINHSEFHNNRYYTVVTTPAPDAFSHPSRFKVQSSNPIGQPNQDVELVLYVSGMVRDKPYVDKVTKQPKTFYEADVYLNVDSVKPYAPAQPATSMPANVKAS